MNRLFAAWRSPSSVLLFAMCICWR